MAIDLVAAVVDSLATHLLAKVAGIQAVLRAFPDPAQDIVYPSISLTVQGPRAFLRMPELLKTEEQAPPTGQVTSYYRIGNLDVPIQMDIWARSASERGEYQDKAILALADQVETYSGSYPSYRNNTTLNLQLANYNSFWASYAMRGLRWADTEDAAARREFRALVDVAAAADLVIVRTLPKLTHMDIDWRSGTGTIAELSNLPPEVQIIF